MSPNPLKINKVWRICNKIRTFVSVQKDKNVLKSKFEALTNGKNELIPQSEFIFVINNFHPDFQLSDDEAADLIEFFQDEKCKINYKNFIEVIQSEIEAENCQNYEQKPFVTGLEWNDHDHVNVLTPFEERHSNLILTKIAGLVKFREIVLEPYFDDYEMMTKNNGVMTIAHFRRVLYNLGVTLGTKEFRLITKKFMKDNFTINYCRFLKEIKEIIEWIEKNGKEEDFCCPGRVISHDFQQLPRPEFDSKVNKLKSCKNQLEEIILRIKKHVLDNSIKIRDFFEQFDKMKRGFVTRNQFARALDSIGVSGLHRLTIEADDVNEILDFYEDSCDPTRVCWCCFCDEIDLVFNVKFLEKSPLKLIECPPSNVTNLNRQGTADWECVPKSVQQCAQQTVFKLRKIIESRGILIEPFFVMFDNSKRKHVTKLQMRRVFSSNSIILCDKEIEALMTRYGNNFGFNYMKFLKDINETYFSESKHEKILKILKLLKKEFKPPCSDPKLTVIELLARIKGQIVRKRINFEEFMRNGEEFIRNREKLSVMKIENFKRNFSAAGIILEECKLEILADFFKIKLSPDYFDHKEFCKIMNEAFYETKLESQPSKIPHQHIPTPDSSLNFLNFEERFTVSKALQKLSKFPDEVSNLTMFFKDYEGEKSGDVTRINFERALGSSGLLDLLSSFELETLFKCFTINRGNCKRFDFINFSAVISEISKMQ